MAVRILFALYTGFYRQFITRVIFSLVLCQGLWTLSLFSLLTAFVEVCPRRVEHHPGALLSRKQQYILEESNKKDQKMRRNISWLVKREAKSLGIVFLVIMVSATVGLRFIGPPVASVHDSGCDGLETKQSERLQDGGISHRVCFTNPVDMSFTGTSKVHAKIGDNIYLSEEIEDRPCYSFGNHLCGYLTSDLPTNCTLQFNSGRYLSAKCTPFDMARLPEFTKITWQAIVCQRFFLPDDPCIVKDSCFLVTYLGFNEEDKQQEVKDKYWIIPGYFFIPIVDELPRQRPFWVKPVSDDPEEDTL
jgi:hypothetical protein